MKLSAFFTLFALISAASGGVANAQVSPDVIGRAVGNSVAQQRVADCLSRPVLSEKEAREADAPSLVVMQKYWARASANDNVSISGLYHPLGKAIWVNHGSEVRAHSQAITDPFARSSGNVLVEKPLAFERSGLGNNARGAWEVRNPSGERVGYYLADFLRSPDWRLHRLELISADSPAPVVRPFCEEPGDIEKFKEAQADVSESWIAKTVKKAKPVGSCLDGPECEAIWSRAKLWIQGNSIFPLIRESDGLLLTPGSYYGDTALSFAVVLGPPRADRRRDIRFRAWCGNFLACYPAPGKAREGFVAATLSHATGAAHSSK